MAKGRKFVFVLGAGASRGAGAFARVQAGGRVPIPIQADFWQTLLRYCGRPAREEIEKFLFRYFLGYERVPARLKARPRAELLQPIDVEEVFTFLSERVRAPSTQIQTKVAMERVWNLLVRALGALFGKFHANASTRAVYFSLTDNQIRKRDTVVSFNYDTVFENSLIKKQKWRYGAIDGANEGLSILKPHGSINWTPGTSVGTIIRCKRNNDFPVIVAPTHLKFTSYSSDEDAGIDDENSHVAGYLDQSSAILKVWSAMEREMRTARAIVFIGYSFPPADLYFSSILRSVLAVRGANPDVVIVNPDAVAIAERLKRRFALQRIVTYFDLQQYSKVSRNEVIRRIENQ